MFAGCFSPVIWCVSVRFGMTVDHHREYFPQWQRCPIEKWPHISPRRQVWLVGEWRGQSIEAKLRLYSYSDKSIPWEFSHCTFFHSYPNYVMRSLFFVFMNWSHLTTWMSLFFLLEQCLPKKLTWSNLLGKWIGADTHVALCTPRWTQCALLRADILIRFCSFKKFRG